MTRRYNRTAVAESPSGPPDGERGTHSGRGTSAHGANGRASDLARRVRASHRPTDPPPPASPVRRVPGYLVGVNTKGRHGRYPSRSRRPAAVGGFPPPFPRAPPACGRLVSAPGRPRDGSGGGGDG